MKNWNKLFVFVFGMALLINLVAVGNNAESKVIEWKFQDTYGATTGPGMYLNIPLMKWVEEVSNGRIKVTRYEPGALASVMETYDALSRGVFDAAALYPGFYTGIMPEGNVEQGLPWGWSDAKSHTISLFKFGLFDIMKKVYAKHNLHLLAHYPMGDVYNVGTVKPVTKLDDLKGLKIRAVGSYADYVKALGASPVSIPYGEMYMAIKMGTIDGYLAIRDYLPDDPDMIYGVLFALYDQADAFIQREYRKAGAAYPMRPAHGNGSQVGRLRRLAAELR